MLFQPLSMQSIRSSNQRSLIAHWSTLAVDRGFPAIDAFSPQPRDHSPEQLILWDVEGDGGSRRFRMRRLGLRAEEALGAGYIGKTMDEVVPDSLKAVSLDGAHECASSGCAIYAIITTIANGHQVDCERLLLPFGGESGAVEQIVASLQLISYQGPVERRDVTRDFETRSYVSLCGRISSDWAMRNAVAPVASAERPAAQGSGGATERAEDNAAPASDTPRGKESRKTARRKVFKTGKIFFGRSREVCTIRDISPTGASIEVANASMVPDRFTLVLEMESASRVCAAVWRKDRQIGVRFG